MFKCKPRKRVNIDPAIREEEVEVPNLLDLQVESYKRFLSEGMREEFKNISPIVGYGGKFELEFLEGNYLSEPEYDFNECKAREISFSAPLKAPVRLINKETGEVKEQEVFMGDIPLMTDQGGFLINGAERVVISQFVRSPGVYFREKIGLTRDKVGYISTIIPSRGAWLEIEADHNGILYVYINKFKKLPVTLFLSAIGFTEDSLKKECVDYELLSKTTDKFPMLSTDESLLEIYKAMRSGEPVTLEGARNYIESMFFDSEKYDLGKVGRYKINTRLEIANCKHTKETAITLTKNDVLETTNCILKLVKKEGMTDDIDHLGHRRVRTVGEQLQRQFRLGLLRLERLVREQMAIKLNEKMVPQHLINIRPLVAIMREFFGSSQLSQFMDQTNPLAEIVHKRRLSALGPGGLAKERAGFEVRDIHATHYGRICPVETPEGPNAGLIGPLATFARVNEYGFIETPYHKVKNGKILEEVDHLTADVEEKYCIAPWDTPTEGNTLTGENVVVRYARQFDFVKPEKVDYIGVSPKQLLGVACGLIPFLEHDDANRALMGANMQRQAVPLVNPEAPYVGTGMERQVARDTGVLVNAETDGKVSYVSGDKIIIKSKSGKSTEYVLQKYQRSNQNTCKTQFPIVKKDQDITKGEVIADGASAHNGELALGRNVLVGFMPWEGYNFEDAIVVSEKLVKNDVFTSIHIHRYEVDVRSTKLGPEELTREVPNVSEETLKDLNEDGIIRTGAVVKAGDILVGKVTPKGETEPPAEEKLLRAIFGDKARDMRDTSLKVSSGESGKVIGVRIFSRETNDDLPPGVNYIVRVYVAQLRKISIGDKVAGRHGNKGVISTILPEEDMP